jgi:hypothetical protein
MQSDCNIQVNTKLPLLEAYRTGSYLSYDYKSGDPDNYREGTTIGLRASGSHQLNLQDLQKRLTMLAGNVKPGGQLYLVDLRQESHAFFNGRAVSWYADKDWANVGQSPEWIQHDEENQIKRLNEWPGANRAKIFCLQKTPGDLVLPTGYSEVAVTSAMLEADVARQMQPAVGYHRFHATDHCKPDADAKDGFLAFCSLTKQADWVHFHCHGGDGRTTTFLAMYDMFWWVKTHAPPYQPVEWFVERQLTIFKYDLNPGNCDLNKDWKCALASERWEFLNQWLSSLTDKT